MSTVVMQKKDEIIMKLVHYFVTEENYNPIVVNGVKDEIWLENSNGPYRIIRINSNNIFNKEQLQFDYYKIENIVKQIKKKTFSFNVNTLNILLDVNEDLKLEETKHIKAVSLDETKDTITCEGILEAFPDINEKMLKDHTGIDLIFSVTKDLNAKTEKENMLYERTFKPKKPIITHLLIALCILMFVICLFIDGFGALRELSVDTAEKLGATGMAFLKDGELWRLITHMFLHLSFIHLALNMYSLYILGVQTETFLGKWKFLIIYLVSGICGALLSGIISGENIISVGASGAIFGLAGALLYFGYHYRTYLGTAIKNQILPIVILNLIIGFTPGIDGFAHLGGLIGGVLTTMALGIDGRSKTYEKVNGWICLLLLIGILSYFLFFR